MNLNQDIRSVIATCQAGYERYCFTRSLHYESKDFENNVSLREPDMNNSGRRVAVPSDRSRLTYPSVIVLSSPESFLWQVAVSRYTQRSNCVVWYTSNHLFVCELDLHKTVAFVFRGALAINYSNQQSLSAAGVRRVLCLV